MTEKLFAKLDEYYDDSPRTAATNMAIDEALLETAQIPSIRFYRWNSPALSFGYFGKFADIALHTNERDLVRRWTGGGIVFHGEDLTYSIVIPARDSAFAESSMSIYENVHRALQNALIASGANAELAQLHTNAGGRSSCDAKRGLAGARPSTVSKACFANPVRADVMMNGRKVAGAAQRRTRGGLLQQGSIQHADLGEGFEERLSGELSTCCRRRQLNDQIVQRAAEIAAGKYATEAWLRKR
ncbi:MAG: hypothetical protein ABI925_11900 [Verrucomicrobiota bacterium]